MIGGISGVSAGFGVMYNPYIARQNARNQAAQALQGGERATVLAARRMASPETPVEPVRPAAPVSGDDRPARLGPVIREGADPAEMAVRMRIRPYEEAEDARKAGSPQNPQELRKAQEPSNGQEDGAAKVGAAGAQAAMEEGKCQTCEERKYQDASDDMGVSFQTPTNIAPEQVASAVRGHENEHVVRERAEAQREDRRVVSQSVTLHTDICPECGKVYISGGTTRTVTAANPARESEQAALENSQRKGFSVFG